MTVKALIEWSRSEHQNLPWRMNRSLYRTLVSEIMLQQTTVSTVRNHFERFLNIFPDLKSLAEASEEDLLVAWKGLGYYRRAKNLKKIAEAIVNEHQGKIPHHIDILQAISGIGPYTANALLAIGMDKPALALDANLERVIARLFALNEPKGPKLHKKIQELFLAGKIFNQKVSFRELNEALMDLGRTFCQARKASCDLCPLKKDCMAFKQGKSLKLPIDLNAKKKSVDHELKLLRVYVIKSGKLLVYQKSNEEWLSGQYEVPTFVLETTDSNLKQYPSIDKYEGEIVKTYKTGITKYKIQNSVTKMDLKTFQKLKFKKDYVWLDLKDKKSNFSTATLKGLQFLQLN
ncbi:MAG: A/G-specific adenine glycosylase [Bacteriovoracaceae bacterium]